MFFTEFLPSYHCSYIGRLARWAFYKSWRERFCQDSQNPRLNHQMLGVKTPSLTSLFTRPGFYMQISDGKITMLSMGKSTISLVIFNSKLLVYQRVVSRLHLFQFRPQGVSTRRNLRFPERPLCGSVSEGSKDGKTQELETHFLCPLKAGL